jgi:hypothetical protein
MRTLRDIVLDGHANWLLKNLKLRDWRMKALALALSTGFSKAWAKTLCVDSAQKNTAGTGGPAVESLTC